MVSKAFLISRKIVVGVDSIELCQFCDNISCAVSTPKPKLVLMQVSRLFEKRIYPFEQISFENSAPIHKQRNRSMIVHIIFWSRLE